MSGVVIPRNFKLLAELEELEKDPPAGISAGLSEGDDIYFHSWSASLIGPDNTSFAGRFYSIELYCGDNYPDEAPTVKFLNKTNMDCVDSNGNVNVNAVVGGWERECAIVDILCGLRELMESPNNRNLGQPGETEHY